MPQRIQKSNFTLIFNLKRNPAKLQSCPGASFSHFLLELFYLKPRQLYVAISLSSWKYSWPNPIISFFHFSSFAIRNTIILGDSNFQEWLLSPYRSIYLFMWSQLLLISLPISFNKTLQLKVCPPYTIVSKSSTFCFLFFFLFQVPLSCTLSCTQM